MVNIREQAESDLRFTLEGGYSLPVILIGPDAESVADQRGITQTVRGQVLYDYVKQNPDTGLDVVVHQPVVTLRTSSLSPVPQAGETWAVKIPTTPSETAALELFVFDSDRPPEGGGSIGFIRLYLQKAQQIDA